MKTLTGHAISAEVHENTGVFKLNTDLSLADGEETIRIVNMDAQKARLIAIVLNGFSDEENDFEDAQFLLTTIMTEETQRTADARSRLAVVS